MRYSDDRNMWRHYVHLNPMLVETQAVHSQERNVNTRSFYLPHGRIESQKIVIRGCGDCDVSP
jgi:hypothetical protein